MNIYLIKRTDKIDWDEYDSAVVAAEDEENIEQALKEGIYGSRVHRDLWKRNSKIKLVGVAVEGTKMGVICSSYNAG